MTRPGALLFDFDGLILDTETCTFETAAGLFVEHGETLDRAWWQSILGNGGRPHWTDVLAAQLGRPVDRTALTARYEARRLAILHDLPACAGVVALLDGAAAAGVPTAVVSSSSAGWVDGHLVRLGLRPRFRRVITADDVGGDHRRTKPAPDLYRIAAEALGADPATCVVLEDSPNGVAAARAAGMTVVAVPGPMTVSLDFGLADHVVASLEDVDVAALGNLLQAP